MDFFKEIAVGFKSAKSYPPGHPVMERVVRTTMTQLSRLYTEIATFSMYFLERTMIFQDLKIDVGKNLAMLALLDAFRKNEINSLTFEPGVSNDDLKNLFEVIVCPKLKIKEYGDAAAMLGAKGTQKIKINAVKFGIHSGETTRVASEGQAALEHADILAAIGNIRHLVEKGLDVIEIKNSFGELITHIESGPRGSVQTYNNELKNIIENMPTEQRIDLLKDLEPKSITLKLLSQLSEETIVNLILAKAAVKNEEDVKKIINVIDDEKFAKIMPKLREKIPNIYEYLAQVGLLLSDKIASTIPKDDLRITMKPYYTMLDSNSAELREEGMKSLITLAKRFTEKKYYELAEEIVMRVSTAIEQESMVEVLSKLPDDLTELYQISKAHNQPKFCTTILDPFSRILGRKGLPVPFQKNIIRFFSETGNPAVLPILFSFLWDTGIYPDVRSAIIKFGKDAVSEALLTLKESEDPGLSRKLVDILRNLGKEGVEMLLDNLDASEWFLRRNIVAILGDIADVSAVNRLMPLIEDKDDRVRLELVKTFAKLKYNEGLLQFLNDSSTEVKTEALRGLGKTVRIEKIKELLPLFQQNGDAMHLELLKIISEKRAIEAVATLLEFLKSLESRNDSASEQLKELGIGTLFKLNPQNLKTILENLLKSKDKKLTHFAKTALKRID